MFLFHPSHEMNEACQLFKCTYEFFFENISVQMERYFKKEICFLGIYLKVHIKNFIMNIKRTVSYDWKIQLIVNLNLRLSNTDTWWLMDLSFFLLLCFWWACNETEGSPPELIQNDDKCSYYQRNSDYSTAVEWLRSFRTPLMLTLILQFCINLFVKNNNNQNTNSE